jgi:hypothetical protein
VTPAAETLDMLPVWSALSTWAVVAVFAPLLAAAAIGLMPRRAEPWSFAGALVTLAATLILWTGTRGGDLIDAVLVEVIPGLSIALRVDALGMTFALLASVLWLIATLYSTGYVRANNLKHRARYYACFAASICTAIGVAFSANLLTFILFYEALTLATYPLVLHKETEVWEVSPGGEARTVFFHPEELGLAPESGVYALGRFAGWSGELAKPGFGTLGPALDYHLAFMKYVTGAISHPREAVPQFTGGVT